ncbi:MAG: hypothetical protein ABIQ47_06240 [Tepidiformaceae bacterium]
MGMAGLIGSQGAWFDEGKAAFEIDHAGAATSPSTESGVCIAKASAYA